MDDEDQRANGPVGAPPRFDSDSDVEETALEVVALELRAQSVRSTVDGGFQPESGEQHAAVEMLGALELDLEARARQAGYAEFGAARSEPSHAVADLCVVPATLAQQPGEVLVGGVERAVICAVACSHAVLAQQVDQGG